MSSTNQLFIWKIASTTLHFIRSKPLTCIILCLLAVVLFFYHDCSMFDDPASLENMKHGFIKTIPDHHIDTSHLGPGVKNIDTLQCAVPPIVHYFWCDKTNFQYQHYLSVLSAYKLLTPTEIIFHYNTLPLRDADGYYQYYEDLLRDLPNFFPEPLDDQRACSENSLESMNYVSEMLNQQGGIALGMNIILSDKVLHYMDKQISRYQPTAMFATNGAMFVTPGALNSFPDKTTQMSSSAIKCVSNSVFSHKLHSCVFHSEELFPFQIFNLQSDFGVLARSIGYGSKEVLTPKPQNSRIPNIIHYVWLGNRTFDFISYLSLLSSVHIQKAETVYIHGDHEPYGEHWEKAKKIPQVKFIYREYPHTVYGHTIKSPSHASDYLRMDILLRYGGIYVDWDLIWVKQLSENQRSYEAIACFDWPSAGHFPDTFNLGIVGAMKSARFVKFMMESFRHYVDSDWGFNAIRIPYKVYEQHPDSLHIDRHTQVICFEGICHPVWLPGYKKDLQSKQDDGPFNWRTETNALHWTFPDPKEFSSMSVLMASSGMYADIGKNVLQKAGKI